MSPATTDIAVLVLAGGKGTRLQSINPNRPKPMVAVKDKPFLHWLVKHFRNQGFRKFVFSTGYLAAVIESYPFQKDFPDCSFGFFRETHPLGTGGATMAVFKTHPRIDSFWVVNGDTLLPLPLPQISEEQSTKWNAIYTVLNGDKLFDAKPNLVVNGEQVQGESAAFGTLFDGGAVWIHRRAIERATASNIKAPCSLAELLKPSMQGRKVSFALLDCTCYDIGTPDRLKRFEKEMDQFL